MHVAMGMVFDGTGTLLLSQLSKCSLIQPKAGPWLLPATSISTSIFFGLGSKAAPGTRSVSGGRVGDGEKLSGASLCFGTKWTWEQDATLCPGAASTSAPSPRQLGCSIRGLTPTVAFCEDQLQCRAIAFVLMFFLIAWKSIEKINKNNCLSAWFIAKATNYIFLCLAITRVFIHVLWRREFAGGLQVKPNQTGRSRTCPSGYASGQLDVEQPGSGSCIAAFAGDALGEGLL